MDSKERFDTEKTEAMLLTRKRNIDWETEIRIGEQVVKFNQQSTRWLGNWIDSSLSLKHHRLTVMKAKNAQRHMHRLTGKMGLVPENARRGPIDVCPSGRSVRDGAMVERREGNGHLGRANQLQIMVNQQARAITGYFKTTDQGTERAAASPIAHQPLKTKVRATDGISPGGRPSRSDNRSTE